MTEKPASRASEAVRHRFVGRGAALDIFYMRLAYRHMKNAVYYYAGGGLGKTWLLEKIVIDHEDDPYQTVPPIIDFFDTQNQNIRGLQATIRERLQVTREDSGEAQQVFQAYDEILQRLEEARKEGMEIHLSAIAGLESRANQEFIECCKQSIINREVILLFDTFERVQQRYVGRWLRQEFLPQVRGLVVAIAGRPVPSPAQMPDNVVSYELPGLDLKAARDHILADRPDISEKDVERIWQHTDGAPLLMDLILDLPESLRRDYLARLRKLKAGVRIQDSPELQQALVAQFTELSDVNRIVWAMAFLRRRFDVQLLRYIVERGAWFSPGDYDNILRELSGSIYVKEYPQQQSHLLHDEIQQLVTEYVLPVVDPWTEMRHPLYELVIDHYYPEATGKAGPALVRQLEAERLGYELDRDPAAGLQAYIAHRRRIEETYDYDLEELLWGEVREHLNGFADRGYMVCRERAQWLHRHSLYQKGEEHYGRMLVQFTEDQIESRQGLGYMQMRQGKLDQALAQFQKSREGVNEKDLDGIAQIERNLGQVQYRLGQWDIALGHYARSFRAATLAGNNELLVSSYVNRAFLYSLQGNYLAAKQQCERALKELASLPSSRENTQREIYAHINLAVAHRHSGDFDAADRHYQDGLILATDNHNQEAICRALQEIGINEHLRGRELRREGGDLAKACRHQQQAWENLANALEIARETRWHSAAADGLHRLAKVYREIDRLQTAKGARTQELDEALTKFEKQAESFSVPFEIEYEHQLLLPGEFGEFDWLGKAARLFEMSALLADEAHDYHRGLDGLTEYAIALLELGQLDKVPLVIRRVERTQGYDYQEALFAAMNQITVGDWHFERGERDEALDMYREAYANLAKQSGYATYLLTDRLRTLERRLHQLEPTEAVRWCDELEEQWLRKSVSSARPDMLDLLEQTRLEALQQSRANRENWSPTTRVQNHGQA